VAADYVITRYILYALSIRSARLTDYSRYSTFQYPDQDAYQDAYPEDFNADALFHVSVSVKRICLYLPYYKQCLHNIVIIHMKMQCLFIQNVVNSNFLSYIRVIFQGYDVLGADYGLDI